ncbi:MAG: zinc ribbon domain-containing protein [Ruminococcaceae bacterium]|nr:zinc ribbon domain-containing protein [Oscillospiraceae bacterium]
MKSERHDSPMKKLKILLLPGIGILLGIYSVIAANTVRGIGVYTIGSGIGQFLSVSRHYTAAASSILLLISVVILVNRILKQRADREQAQADSATAMTESQPVKTEPEKSAEETPAVPAPSAPAPDAQESAAAYVPKCAKCGAVLKEGAKFCEKCGERVADAAAGADPVN